MQEFKSFSDGLLNLSPEEFESRALSLFDFQSTSNQIYAEYLDARKINPKKVRKLEDIPFLPIEFFKNHPIICGNENAFKSFYSSSGTTGRISSKHYIWSEDWYLNHSLKLFEQNYGKLEDFHVLALLPAYLERKGSSLVSMANHWIKESKSEYSGFYLYNQDDLIRKINVLGNSSKKTLLLGVTFALLDLAESKKSFTPPDNLIVMETGGMKGRRKEMIREEVHDILKPFFGVSSIHSEYGMTELMSQSYSKGDGKYTIPPCMNVILRDLNDPFSKSIRSQGAINIIDLANFHSCAFIETQDLGRMNSDGTLEVLGRIDNSEIRGCNLLV